MIEGLVADRDALAKVPILLVPIGHITDNVPFTYLGEQALNLASLENTI